MYFRRTNWQSTEAIFTKTCLHILLYKYIQMLDSGAEVLCYCDDRALQSCCPKTSIIRQFTLLSDTALQFYTKRVKCCNYYCLLGLLMCTFKRAIVCYYSFTKEAMIVNKQACQVLQYQTDKNQKRILLAPQQKFLSIYYQVTFLRS